MGIKTAVVLLHMGIKTAVALVIGAFVAESFQHTPSIGRLFFSKIYRSSDQFNTRLKGMGSRLLSSEQYSGEQRGMDGVDDVVGVTSRGGVTNP
jgi:hypothetical protein